MNFIDNLSKYIKKKSDKSKVALFLSLFIFFSCFIANCTSHKTAKSIANFPLTAEERVSIKEFFRDLLFENQGAYTLYGTKPVSISCLTPPSSPEEIEKIKAYYDSLPEEERPQMKEKLYDYESNYQKWQTIKHRFAICQYLFGSFPSRFNESVEIVFFVNIEETLRILLRCYEDFRRILGYDFDPMTVTFEVEDRDSKFWRDVLQSHALLGILLGFDRDDSWFFEWDREFEESQNKKGDFIRTLPSTFYDEPDIYYPDPQNFMLPPFRIYGLHPDSVLNHKYEQERKFIKKLYQGRDEVDVALEWLTRQGKKE